MKLQTYVLNLDRHTQRLQDVATQLDAQGIAWTRVSGYDAKAVGPEVLDSLVERSGSIPRMPNGARTCAAGHIKIVHEFLNSDATHALVLEDDAVLSSDFGEALPKLVKEFGTGVLHIGRQNPSGSVKRIIVRAMGKQVAGYNVRALKGIHYTTIAYIIDRTAAELILQHYAKPNMPIDHVLFNPNVSVLFGKTPIAQAFPAMVKPRENLASSIQLEQVEGARTLRNRLKRAKSEVSIAPRLLLGLLIGRYQAKVLDFKGDLG